MTITKQQGEAMAEAVSQSKRKKSSPAGDWQTEMIRDLQNRLQVANQELRDLRFELGQVKRSGGHAINGRAVISPEEAAQHLRVSVSSVNRALNGRLKTRKLEGYQNHHGQWKVYTDSLAGYRLPRTKKS